MTRLYISPNDQLAMFRGAKPPPESHANRGMAFEAALATMHEVYRRRGDAVINKQQIRTRVVGDGKFARVEGKATVDYEGTLKGGRHVAFDAKDCANKRIDLSRLTDDQLGYLMDVHNAGAVAFVLARFERRDVYAIPVTAWRWAEEARRVGKPITADGWQATGKASINVDELPERWRVEGYDWETRIREEARV